MDLSEALTPSKIVEKLASRGIVISERTLREKARQTGFCRVMGKTMFFLPDDIDGLLDALKPAKKANFRVKTRAPSAVGGGSLEKARARLKTLKSKHAK